MKRFCMFFLCLFGQVFLFGDYEVNPEKMHFIEAGMRRNRYHNIVINGREFTSHCARNWKERWDIIEANVDMKGKRVLDVGGYIGFVPIFAMRYKGASAGACIDKVSPKRGRNIAAGFEVDVEFFQESLDSSRYYEDRVGYNYDIVFCLSVYNWVKDKVRLLEYLSWFDTIVYEGHDTAEVEIARFEEYGYKHKILGTSYSGMVAERGREMILFYRD